MKVQRKAIWKAVRKWARRRSFRPQKQPLPVGGGAALPLEVSHPPGKPFVWPRTRRDLASIEFETQLIIATLIYEECGTLLLGVQKRLDELCSLHMQAECVGLGQSRCEIGQRCKPSKSGLVAPIPPLKKIIAEMRLLEDQMEPLETECQRQFELMLDSVTHLAALAHSRGAAWRQRWPAQCVDRHDLFVVPRGGVEESFRLDGCPFYSPVLGLIERVILLAPTVWRKGCLPRTSFALGTGEKNRPDAGNQDVSGPPCRDFVGVENMVPGSPRIAQNQDSSNSDWLPISLEGEAAVEDPTSQRALTQHRMHSVLGVPLTDPADFCEKWPHLFVTGCTARAPTDLWIHLSLNWSLLPHMSHVAVQVLHHTSRLLTDKLFHSDAIDTTNFLRLAQPLVVSGTVEAGFTFTLLVCKILINDLGAPWEAIALARPVIRRSRNPVQRARAAHLVGVALLMRLAATAGVATPPVYQLGVLRSAEIYLRVAHKLCPTDSGILFDLSRARYDLATWSQSRKEVRMMLTNSGDGGGNNKRDSTSQDGQELDGTPDMDEDEKNWKSSSLYTFLPDMGPRKPQTSRNPARLLEEDYVHFRTAIREDFKKMRSDNRQECSTEGKQDDTDDESFWAEKLPANGDWLTAAEAAVKTGVWLTQNQHPGLICLYILIRLQQRKMSDEMIEHRTETGYLKERDWAELWNWLTTQVMPLQSSHSLWWTSRDDILRMVTPSSQSVRLAMIQILLSWRLELEPEQPDGPENPAFASVFTRSEELRIFELTSGQRPKNAYAGIIRPKVGQVVGDETLIELGEAPPGLSLLEAEILDNLDTLFVEAFGTPLRMIMHPRPKTDRHRGRLVSFPVTRQLTTASLLPPIHFFPDRRKAPPAASLKLAMGAPTYLDGFFAAQDPFKNIWVPGNPVGNLMTSHLGTSPPPVGRPWGSPAPTLLRTTETVRNAWHNNDVLCVAELEANPPLTSALPSLHPIGGDRPFVPSPAENLSTATQSAAFADPVSLHVGPAGSLSVLIASHPDCASLHPCFAEDLLDFRGLFLTAIEVAHILRDPQLADRVIEFHDQVVDSTVPEVSIGCNSTFAFRCYLTAVRELYRGNVSAARQNAMRAFEFGYDKGACYSVIARSWFVDPDLPDEAQAYCELALLWKPNSPLIRFFQALLSRHVASVTMALHPEISGAQAAKMRMALDGFQNGPPPKDLAVAGILREALRLSVP